LATTPEDCLSFENGNAAKQIALFARMSTQGWLREKRSSTQGICESSKQLTLLNLLKQLFLPIIDIDSGDNIIANCRKN
jgi:hypothetical protein